MVSSSSTCWADCAVEVALGSGSNNENKIKQVKQINKSKYLKKLKNHINRSILRGGGRTHAGWLI